MEASTKKRILTAAIGLPLILLLLFLPTPFVIGVVILVSAVGMHEYSRAVHLRQKKLLAMGYLAVILIPFGIFFSQETTRLMLDLYIMVLFLILLVDHREVGFDQLALLVMGVLYIPYFLSHVIYIRAMEFGNLYFCMVFIGAFMTDSCAFFSGKAIGGRKLCPSISPKKTVAGAIGGVIGCGLSFVLYGLIVNGFFSGCLDGQRMSLEMLFVLGLLCAAASEVGDLAASMLKRQYGIKDFGNLLPGHGGILDRCDSILLVAPVIYLFLCRFGVMV